MAPNVVLNLSSTKQLKSVGKATDSVTERSGFPPKPIKSVAKTTNSVTERLVSSPVNLFKKLVFTEFGLSRIVTMPSPDLYLSPAEPYTAPRLPPLKPESQRSHPQPNIKANNGCRCKQSRCLKLYCECFAAGAYCDGCNCSGCENNVDNDPLRQAAVESILERNPYAFGPKIISSPCSALDKGDDTKNVPMVGKHNRGCGCKKTGCLKNYCECYHAKVLCSENCKCVDCKNFEGCVEMMALSKRDYNNTENYKRFAGCEEKMVVSSGDNSYTNTEKDFEACQESEAVADGNHSNTDICKSFRGSKEKMTFPGGENDKRKICIQQVNAAISTAVGLSGHSFLQASRKRNFHEFLDSNDKDPPNERAIEDQKANPLRVSGSLSAFSVDPADHVVSSATLGSSKFHCRSLLADTIHSRDVEELCSLLVLVAEAAKILTDKNGTSYIQAMRENQTANIVEVQDMENCLEQSDVQKEVHVDHSSGNQTDTSGGIDLREERLSSLEKIALMCNDKDRSFMEAAKPGQIPNHGCNADVYIKQEKLVLASFRNCLRKIITLGDMSASHQLESMAGQCQHVGNPLQKTESKT